jgi:glutamate dehydrogenase
MPALKIETANMLPLDSPGTMSNSKNPAVANLATDDTSRRPSPQPTHFSVPLKHHSNGHRTLRSATVGYVAPEFTGKVEQMKEGKLFTQHIDLYSRSSH